MKYALFLGCKIPYYIEQYDSSTRALFDLFDMDWVDIKFNCCGYPIRNLNFESYILSAARNMALAERKQVDILTPCKCCYGSFKHAQFYLQNYKELKDKVNEILKKENLMWNNHSKVKHILTVLHDEIGIQRLRTKIKNRLKTLKVAVHYGCHALRPSHITHFDNPLNPSIFEHLIEITEAPLINWSKKLECCGHPIWGKNDKLSLDLMQKKIDDAIQAGADVLCTACSYCQIQFDDIQIQQLSPAQTQLDTVLVTQLLGLSMGIEEMQLGIHKNKTNAKKIYDYVN